MSIVQDFHRLKKFNLQSIFEATLAEDGEPLHEVPQEGEVPQE
jgi:hypothetical protein